MEDLNVTVAGVAGQGVQTIGDVLTQTAAAQGYAVFNWKEYLNVARKSRPIV